MSLKNQLKKLNSMITLLCPTCGNEGFPTDGLETEDNPNITCPSCNRVFTKDELIEENGENIQAHVQDVGKEISKLLQAHLKNSFK